MDLPVSSMLVLDTNMHWDSGTVPEHSPTVLWDCFAATGTLCSNRIMKEHYLQIHQLHLKSTVRRLKLGHSREFQQNNDPKHTTLFLEWIKQASIKVLECPSGRPQTRVFCPEDSSDIRAEICRSLLMATCATC